MKQQLYYKKLLKLCMFERRQVEFILGMIVLQYLINTFVFTNNPVDIVETRNRYLLNLCLIMPLWLYFAIYMNIGMPRYILGIIYTIIYINGVYNLYKIQQLILTN
jgi:hypothetical protein